jgi:hypothetical protein
MSLSIFDRGEGRFDLMLGDAEIGWVDDRAIGFTGFGVRAAARRAAAVAYDALTGWLARQRRFDAPPRNGNTLRVQRDGATDQLMLGEIPIGALLHRGTAVADGGYAFELLLPPRVGATLSAAQVMYYALERYRAARKAGEMVEIA